jgi:hypothetical protein
VEKEDDDPNGVKVAVWRIDARGVAVVVCIPFLLYSNISLGRSRLPVLVQRSQVVESRTDEHSRAEWAWLQGARRYRCIICSHEATVYLRRCVLNWVRTAASWFVMASADARHVISEQRDEVEAGASCAMTQK